MKFLVIILILANVIHAKYDLYENCPNSLSYYIFVDANNCHTCDFQIQDLRDSYEGCFYIFIDRAENLDDFVNNRIENCTYVPDKLGLYKKHYNAKSVPYLIIFDDKGNNLYEGNFKFGNVTKTAINKVIEGVSFDTNLPIHRTKLPTSFRYFTKQKDKVIYIFDEVRKFVYKYDILENSGELLDFSDLYAKVSSTGIYSFDIYNNNIYFLDVSLNGISRINKYDISNDSLETYEIPENNQDENFGLYFTIINRTQLIIQRRFINNYTSKLNYYKDLCLLEYQKGKVEKNFDAIDSTFIKYSASDYQGCKINRSNEKIIKMYHGSNKVKIFDVENLENSNELHLNLSGTNFKLIDKDFTSTKNIEMEIEEMCSLSLILNIDLVDNNLILFYENRNHPVGSQDYFDSERKYQRYIIIYDIENKELIEKRIGDSESFYYAGYKDGIIYYFDANDKYLTIYEMTIN